MSSFDDRVQRAIAAAMREHLQYHLDDQQTGLDSSESSSDHQCEGCKYRPNSDNPQDDHIWEKLWDMADKIKRIEDVSDLIKHLLDALGGNGNDHHTPELGVPTLPDTPSNTDALPIPDGGPAPSIPAVPSINWQWWLEFLRNIPKWLPAPGTTLPMVISYFETGSNQSQLLPEVMGLSSHVYRIEQQLQQFSDKFQTMEHCCQEVNRKLDTLIEHLLPDVPQENDEDEPEPQPGSMEVDFHGHATICTDVTQALHNLDADELLAFLLSTSAYDFSVVTSTNDSSSNAESTVVTMTSRDVVDQYAVVSEGATVYEYLVTRQVQDYTATHQRAQLNTVEVHTWITYWPINPACGDRGMNHYVETDFDVSSHTDTDVIDGGSGRYVEIVDSQGVAVTTTIPVGKTTEDVVSSSGATTTTIPKSSGPEGRTYGGSAKADMARDFGLTPDNPIGPGDTQKGASIVFPSVAGDIGWGPNSTQTITLPVDVVVEAGRVTASGALNRHNQTELPSQGTDIWKKGDYWKQKEYIANLKTGDVIPAEALTALGYANVENRDAVVTNIEIETRISHGKGQTQEGAAEGLPKVETHQTGIDFGFTETVNLPVLPMSPTGIFGWKSTANDTHTPDNPSS
jgi:hypothetical protein